MYCGVRNGDRLKRWSGKLLPFKYIFNSPLSSAIEEELLNIIY